MNTPSSFPTIVIDLSAVDITPKISMNMLVTSQNALLQTEQVVKQKIFTVDFDLLHTNLLSWSANGFQPSVVVYEFSLVSQALVLGEYKCSDGKTRNIWDWLYFILGCDLPTYVTKVQEHLSGIKLTFSLQEDPSIVLRLHAER